MAAAGAWGLVCRLAGRASGPDIEGTTSRSSKPLLRRPQAQPTQVRLGKGAPRATKVRSLERGAVSRELIQKDLLLHDVKESPSSIGRDPRLALTHARALQARRSEMSS